MGQREIVETVFLETTFPYLRLYRAILRCKPRQTRSAIQIRKSLARVIKDCADI